MELSTALKRFRKEFKITQKQAAQAANVSERNYQDYEYGKVIPTVTVLISLADYFDVSLDYLVGRTDNSTNYFKYHKIVMSYGEAEKYIKAGWCLESVQKVLLKGIDKEYEECRLVWKQEGEPIIPPDLD